jgi:hypothetical protein
LICFEILDAPVAAGSDLAKIHRNRRSLDIWPLVSPQRGDVACDPCVESWRCKSRSDAGRNRFYKSAGRKPIHEPVARVGMPRWRRSTVGWSHIPARHRDTGTDRRRDLFISSCAVWKLAVGYVELGLVCSIGLALQKSFHGTLDLLRIAP